MKFSTIPRVSARPNRKRNPWIVGNDLGPVPVDIRAKAPKVNLACAYCGKVAGRTQDHVVPKSFYRRKQLAIPALLKGTVPACLNCNTLKGTRRLIPRSWRHLLPLLNEVFPGTPWRVWSGDVTEPAYREVHLSPSVTSLDVTHCQEPARAE